MSPLSQDTQDELVGTWDATSFERNESGSAPQEELGRILDAFRMKFNRGGPTTGTVTFTLAPLAILGQDDQTSSGSYEVRANGEVLAIGTDELNMDLSGNTLTLDGPVGSQFWTIVATKR
jgi:hypothetical protein